MWQCPKCGEAIEDTFDSCWNWLFVVWLGKDAWRLPTATRSRSLLLTYWKRGWLIMLLNVCIGLLGAVGGAVGAEVTGVRQAFGVITSLVWLVGFMPAAAYWLFVLFFGEEA